MCVCVHAHACTSFAVRAVCVSELRFLLLWQESFHFLLPDLVLGPRLGWAGDKSWFFQSPPSPHLSPASLSSEGSGCVFPCL